MSGRITPSSRDALMRLDVFCELGETVLEALAGVTNLRRYRKDMFIFVEGESAEAFFFVHDGSVKVFKVTPDGNEQTLHLLQPGDLFAVTGFVIPGGYPGTAQTLQDSWIGSVSNHSLRSLVQRESELGWAMLHLFGQRLTGTSRHLLDIGTRDAAGRLASALLELAGRDYDTVAPVSIKMHWTHRELAQFIGTSRETVTRLLAEFRRQGCIEPTPDGRLLLDPKKLAPFLN